ncbi:putative transferase [Rosa chinensis]|uniref:Putative transferase n=1 Tax=Rosa chinensis TaxID=74649 RepID=A0A2P6Q8B8_ROSCH|nr:putative transferase [Rosa chinensis]
MRTTCWILLTLTLGASLIPGAHLLSETEALNAFKKNLSDPQNVLSTWNANQADPCSWSHIVCNQDKKVTEVFLINSQLSGHLVP